MSPVSSRDGRLHAAMAGRGNPYGVLTPERLPLLRALHDDDRVSRIARALGRPEGELTADLVALLDAGLIENAGGRYAANFVIVAAADVRRVDAHAGDIGRQLAARLLAGWGAIEEAFSRLSFARRAGLSSFGFFLVGDRVLDIGLLDALAVEGRLMPSAPPRPTAADPQARYYLWLIEGSRADLGQYGQRTTALPWPGWELLTFGRYSSADNSAQPAPHSREALEVAVLARARDRRATPAVLAGEFGLPLFERVDAAAWDQFALEISSELLAIYLAAEPSLRRLWATLPASRRRPEAFGEFFCWYDHLAYAHALDHLVAAGVLALPPFAFSAALWQTSGSAGEF